MKYRHLLAALLSARVDRGRVRRRRGGELHLGRFRRRGGEHRRVGSLSNRGCRRGAAGPQGRAADGTPPEGDTAELNIAQIAAGTAAVTNLTQLVVKAGLVPTLRDGGPFTVFAPVNEAFDALPFSTYISVVEDNATLTTVLTQHVVPGTYTAADLMDLDGESLETVQGGRLLVEVDGDDVVVGGATVVVPDIEASNGMIHAIDSVIAEPNG